MTKTVKIIVIAFIALVSVLLIALAVSFVFALSEDSPSTSIIGGADGPTAIFITKSITATSVFFFLGALIGGLSVGAFCGAFPLIVGIVKKKTTLGIIGLCVSILFGALMTTVFSLPAILSIIPASVFAIVIFCISGKK